jgi:Domain of unknown function (DUF5666)
MVKTMRTSVFGFSLAAVLWMPFVLQTSARAQSQQPPNEGQAPAPPPSATQDGGEGSPEGAHVRGRGVFGKITALQSDLIEVSRPDGTKVSVKLSSSTEFRKEREPAKVSDFKVGDMVMIRTDQELGESSEATALVVSSALRGFVGRTGRGAPGGMPGTMGKDFVAGEVTSVDPPRLTIMRLDQVEQTLELNEETSLRRGRDSITLADIRSGDHIFARGAVSNDVFIPKGLNVIPPEQWKRIEEMNAESGTRDASPQGAPPRPAPQNPPEQPN